MAIEKKEVEFAKELDDVMVLLVELVKDIKAKKEAGLILSENIQHLMDAVSGVDQLNDELKDNLAVSLKTVGYRVGDLAGALVAPAE